MSETLRVGQTLPGKTQAVALQPIGGLTFDWLMIAVCCWFTGGVFTDGWAHTHIPQLETFFTPWHAVLYSGYLSVALFLLISLYRNHERGYTWSRALPPGYGLALLGVGIFAISGLADMTWHIVFGIEQNIEALFSPTHLGLACGNILCVAAPIRAAWRRPASQSRGWVALLPACISLAFVLSIFTFFTEYAHPFVELPGTLALHSSNVAFGMASILLQGAVLVGVVLLLVRRFSLPFGTFTLLFTINIALISILGNHYQLIPTAMLAGLVVDLLYWYLKPSTTRSDMLRLFAFATPVVFYLCYFLGLALLRGVDWSLDLWLGSVFTVGVVGFLLSYLVAPPQGPAVQE